MGPAHVSGTRKSRDRLRTLFIIILVVRTILIRVPTA